MAAAATVSWFEFDRLVLVGNQTQAAGGVYISGRP